MSRADELLAASREGREPIERAGCQLVLDYLYAVAAGADGAPESEQFAALDAATALGRFVGDKWGERP